MIIFDTNAVNLLDAESTRADFIRKLRRSGHHRVAVPWMVMEEMAAHQSYFYPDKYRSVLTALEKLDELLPWKVESLLEPLDTERLLDHWRGIYGEIFEVIETSGEAALKALAREAMRLPPAKRAKDHSEGARDVAIWFSILEYLKANPDEHVYFITNNTTDFGDGTTYPYPMDEDVRGLEARLTRLTDFNDVLARFSKEVPGQDAEAAADELLRSLPIRQLVAQTALEALNSVEYAGVAADGTPVDWSGWLAQPEVELLNISDVTGHEIEGDGTRPMRHGCCTASPSAGQHLTHSTSPLCGE
ncbi:PIN domain-containing protein [Streptomyces niveus]|uniref:PIN domain-containing protein n=1 Tax=Streptomyces niveus TaxID=193462 RepID=UPI0034188FE8